LRLSDCRRPRHHILPLLACCQAGRPRPAQSGRGRLASRGVRSSSSSGPSSGGRLKTAFVSSGCDGRVSRTFSSATGPGCRSPRPLRLPGTLAYVLRPAVRRRPTTPMMGAAPPVRTTVPGFTPEPEMRSGAVTVAVVLRRPLALQPAQVRRKRRGKPTLLNSELFKHIILASVSRNRCCNRSLWGTRHDRPLSSCG